MQPIFRSLNYYAGCCAAVGLILTASLGKAQAEPGNPFTRIALANFTAWDINHNGKLEDSELHQWMLDPSIHGEKAACLATLKRFTGVHSKNPIEWTEAEIRSLDGKGDDGDVSVENQNIKTKSCPKLFTKFKHKIETASHKLYAFGHPNLDKIHQGINGDCYFLAPIGAMVYRDSQQVMAMLSGTAEATEVHFPGQEVIKLPAPTDAEIASYSDCAEDGVWLLQLDKAFGEIRQKGNNKFEGMEAEAVTGGGGNGRYCFKILTGLETTRLKLHDNSVEDARKTIQAAVRDHKVIMLSTGSDTMAKRPRGIPSGHGLAILGYNTKKQTAHVWNPWSNNIVPKNADILESGYATTNGQFDISIADLCKYFVGCDIEAGGPNAVTDPASSSGDHPHYRQALTDLRAALGFVDRLGSEKLENDERHAMNQIEDAIKEIKKASIDDNQGPKQHPTVDAGTDRVGRLRRAIELLDAAKQDCQVADDNGGLKERVLNHIEKARSNVLKGIQQRGG